MNSFNSILVDIDATAPAQPALERAANLARTTGARLRIVDAGSIPAETRHDLRPDLEDALLRRRRQQLAKIAYGVRDVTVDHDVIAGAPAEALVREVLRVGHDLVVRAHARDLVAAHPTSFAAVDVYLLRHCPCPVWAVGPGVGPLHPKIVGLVDAASDDSVKQRMNAKVIELALLLTRKQDGALTLLHAWRPFAEKRVHSLSTNEDFAEYLDSSRRHAKSGLARLADSYGAKLAGVQLELRRGEVEDVVPEFVVAAGVDIAVIGTMGWGSLSHRLIGNTAERVLRRLPCSLLVVKPDTFVSSVRLE